MPTPPPRAPGRWQAPWVAALWILFLCWTGLVALVWISGIGEAEVLAWTQRQFHLAPHETGAPLRSLQSVLVSFLKWIDPTWAVLAAANVYAFTAAREGLTVARRWAGVIFAGVAVVAWASAKTGWPLGPIRYTGLLGPRIGPVPMGLPLLWLAVLLGARDLGLRLWPNMSQPLLAFVVAEGALLFDAVLEPVASKQRVFWLWPPGSVPAQAWAPWQNYFTWFVVAALLAYTQRGERVITKPRPAASSPSAVYVLMLAVALLADAAARH